MVYFVLFCFPWGRGMELWDNNFSSLFVIPGINSVGVRKKDRELKTAKDVLVTVGNWSLSGWGILGVRNSLRFILNKSKPLEYVPTDTSSIFGLGLCFSSRKTIGLVVASLTFTVAVFVVYPWFLRRVGQALTVLATHSLKTSGWLHCQSNGIFSSASDTKCRTKMLSRPFLCELLLYHVSSLFFLPFKSCMYLLAGSITEYLTVELNGFMVFEGII